MAAGVRRARRFSLLAQVQKTRVESAARNYQLTQQNLQEARDKLASLEQYFTDGPLTENTTCFPAALNETSVFGARLGDAIEVQKTLCQQLDAQSELSRQFLLNAEKRRAGLESALAQTVRKQEVEREKLEQRRVEDNLMASYCRSD